MEYVDFTIRIAADEANRFRLEAKCPAGEASEEFSAPYSPRELESSFWGLPASEPSREFAPRNRGCPTDTKSVGGRIFEALMPRTVLSRFDECLGTAEAEGRGVRIKLLLNPLDSRVAWLGLIPWEMIYRASRNEFLGLSRCTPISRYLDSPYSVSPTPRMPPLRILVATSRPLGVEPLDLHQEFRQLCQSWSQGMRVEVDSLDRATPDALRDRLCQRWDIFHFMGHGGFDENGREGYLIFENDDGTAYRMSDERLAILFQGAERPRLIVLNACETARITADAKLQSVTGAAPMLVRAGIPAVAAMLHPISDQAALLFTKALHDRLAAGDPIDVAMAEGRRAIHGQVPWLEWAKPALFMRLPDGRLFMDGQEASSMAPERVRDSAEVSIQEIESKDIIVGGMICEGHAVFQGSAEGEAKLQAERAKCERFMLGGKVFLKGNSGTGGAL